MCALCVRLLVCDVSNGMKFSKMTWHVSTQNHRQRWCLCLQNVVFIVDMYCRHIVTIQPHILHEIFFIYTPFVCAELCRRCCVCACVRAFFVKWLCWVFLQCRKICVLIYDVRIFERVNYRQNGAVSTCGQRRVAVCGERMKMKYVVDKSEKRDHNWP